MIERRIITGMIVSTDFLRQVYRIYDPRFIEGPALQKIAGWCIDYFAKYEKAPFRDIEGIFYEKLKKGLSPDLAEKIEEDILPELSEEYEQESFNHQYLLDQAKTYFKKRNLELYSDQIKALITEDELSEAEKIAYNYNSVSVQNEGLTLNDPEQVNESIEQAFNEAEKPLVKYAGSLGMFWNDQLVRGGFVCLLAPEKRGKTWLLMDIALKANKQGNNVIFFQAGDMTENQMLRRICVSLTGLPLKKKYLGDVYFTVPDCWLNQTDQCDRNDRECDCGLENPHNIHPSNATYNSLISAYENNPDYRRCVSKSCMKYRDYGAIWVEKKKLGKLVSKEISKRRLNKLFAKRPARFKIETYSNGSLTMNEIFARLNTLEKDSGFVPDVIVIDYADLIEPDKNFRDQRHGLNEVWKGMRRLNQEKHCLLVTATQADAQSYESGTLKLKHFSEDKRKYAHVTAMYGLNQDKEGREKKLGLLRLNQLVVREDEFEVQQQVHVLQRLRVGKPVAGSFFVTAVENEEMED